MGKRKRKRILSRIEKLTRSYAYHCREWNMLDEGDYQDWVDGIENILKGETNE